MSVLLKRPIYIICPAVNVSRLMLLIILAIIDFGIKHKMTIVVCHSSTPYVPVNKAIIFCVFELYTYSEYTNVSPWNDLYTSMSQSNVAYTFLNERH